MYGKATLDIPASEDIGPSQYGGLSDELAMVTGRVAAMTLSDRVPVEVTLNDGTSIHIGLDEHGCVKLWDDMDEISDCRLSVLDLSIA